MKLTLSVTTDDNDSVGVTLIICPSAFFLFLIVSSELYSEPAFLPKAGSMVGSIMDYLLTVSFLSSFPTRSAIERQGEAARRHI